MMEADTDRAVPSGTMLCILWWESTSVLSFCLRRPKEDVAVDSLVYLDLIFSLLPYPNQLHLITSLAALL